MYTSFHFCSVVCPVVLWMPGTSFCTLLGGHRLRGCSLILSQPSSSRSSVSHLYWMETCPSGAPTWVAGKRPWPPAHGEATVCRWLCAWCRGAACGRQSPSGGVQIPLILVWPAPSCRKLLFARLFSFSGTLGPVVESPQSSTVLGENSWQTWREALMVGGFSSFTEKCVCISTPNIGSWCPRGKKWWLLYLNIR